ncbi:glutathione S-transferase family protein [Sphingosinicella sp. LHD-64]|uniref:glutathione S-transferase family protein n=1 Tax=Sphingosinicella sp. LHD-64 TaxID=3072139 RepID=UPI00280F6C8F|nr:glutathione S-transferase family protein [Sphingosinicella sp. LHD-64]MDQ8756311.1 glutathione S-transferase family protein [Sphingosinicella sp. LHD-64]
MKLLYQTHSPYARKVLVFLHEAGLADRVAVAHHETSPTNANEEVFAHNPLGKVPVLLRPGLAPVFDSDVICSYLDTLHGRPPLIPPTGEARWRALELQAVAQGLAEAGIAVRWESVRRPEHLRYPPLRAGHEKKLVESYRWLDQMIARARDVDVGQIALATALDWLEFRDLPSFRDCPRLSAWFDEFAGRPSMRATPLSGDTHD